METQNAPLAVEIITFKGRSFTVVENCKVPALLASEGLTRQVIVEGARGATKFLQFWNAGSSVVMRAISASGRVEEQIA